MDSRVSAGSALDHHKVLEAIAHDLRIVVRMKDERPADPSAVILNARTLQSTPESRARGGYDGAKRRKGSKTHVAMDTLGNLLALVVTPASEQDRAHAGDLAKQVQEVTDRSVERACVDQGYTGESASTQAEAESIQPEL